MVKETALVISSEKNRMFECFDSVPSFTLNVCDIDIAFEFTSKNFYYTMVDGKVASILENVSSQQVCRLCLASPKMMNDIDKMSKSFVKKEALIYGIHPMHCRIRGLKWMWHVAIRDIDGVR